MTKCVERKIFFDASITSLPAMICETSTPFGFVCLERESPRRDAFGSYIGAMLCVHPRSIFARRPSFGAPKSALWRVLQVLLLAFTFSALLSLGQHHDHHGDDPHHGDSCPLCRHAGGSPKVLPPPSAAILIALPARGVPPSSTRSFATHSLPNVRSASPRGPPTDLS